MMQDLELGMPTQQSELDLPQADDIRINDLGPVMRAANNGIELARMSFRFPPSGPKGGPVFNFRSEGSFADSRRCLILASAFFEFTGKKYPKAKHRFALKDSSITAIVGIWRKGRGNHPPAFTMLTTAPVSLSPLSQPTGCGGPTGRLGGLVIPYAAGRRPVARLPAGSLEATLARGGRD
jgi:putative SOS response-associated peptidase YedK